MSIIQNVAMKAVIAHEGKILLLKESCKHDTNVQADRYQFPGGRLELGEPFLDGLRREVMEETGMEIGVGKPLFVGEWFPVIKGVPHQIVAMFMICTPLTTRVALSEEHVDYKWVTYEQSLQYDVMKPDDEVVATYFKTQ